MDTKTTPFLSPEGKPYPPHMQALLAKCKAHDDKKLSFKFTITDVTPKGYGPND